MNKDETVRVRELLAKATPGPWSVDDCLILTEHENWLRQVVADTGDSVEMFNAKGEAHDASAANAELIVAAVNALSSLLNTAERANALEAENKRLREALEPFALNDPAWTGDGSLQIEMRAVDGEPQPCVTLADVRRARAALKGEGA